MEYTKVSLHSSFPRKISRSAHGIGTVSASVTASVTASVVEFIVVEFIVVELIVVELIVVEFIVVEPVIGDKATDNN